MLESFKRLFAGKPEEAAAWVDVEAWAPRRGLAFRRARDGAGFVIEGQIGERPWRLEWGPPQRTYIVGHELRMRMELDLPGDLQMLLMTRALMDRLERQTYESFTEGLQTQIDTATPEEMRWLVMFQRVGLGALRARLGAVAALPSAVQAWLEGALTRQLERALGTLLERDPPFVLMTLRGRAYLRMQLPDPDPAALEAAIGLFETAVQQAQRVASGGGEPGAEWPSTGSTAWQSFDDSKPR